MTGGLQGVTWTFPRSAHDGVDPEPFQSNFGPTQERDKWRVPLSIEKRIWDETVSIPPAVVSLDCSTPFENKALEWFPKDP
jgi:hypothetical protein